jgi:hypothetical protein
MNTSTTALLSLVLVVTGCAAAAEAPSDSDEAAVIATSEKAVHVHGRFVNFLNGTPIVEASVCGESGACVPTDATGTFTFDVASKTDVLLVAKKDGFMPLALPVHAKAGDLDIGGYNFVPRAVYAQSITMLGGTVDPAKGVVMCNLRTGFPGGAGVAGASVEVVSQVTPNPRVTYAAPNGIPDAALTATSARGLVSIGQILPDTIELTVEGRTCRPGLGWPSTTAATRLPAVADAITAATVVCD